MMAVTLASTVVPESGSCPDNEGSSFFFRFSFFSIFAPSFSPSFISITFLSFFLLFFSPTSFGASPSYIRVITMLLMHQVGVPR